MKQVYKPLSTDYQTRKLDYDWFNIGLVKWPVKPERAVFWFMQFVGEFVSQFLGSKLDLVVLFEVIPVYPANGAVLRLQALNLIIMGKVFMKPCAA